jgi:hypothetical protein
MLNAIMLSIVILIVVKLLMLNAIMLSIVILIVVTPF